MAKSVHQNFGRGKRNKNRVHRNDDRGERVGSLQAEWPHVINELITQIGPNMYAVKTKELVGRERPYIETIQQHDAVVLYRVLGKEGQREQDRHVGYCLVFSGAPTIHRYTRYVSLSYSEPADIRFRQMKVLHDDAYVRFTRFGMGSFDYLWQVKRRLPYHHEVPVADHAAYCFYEKTWKEGI